MLYVIMMMERNRFDFMYFYNYLKLNRKAENLIENCFQYMVYVNLNNITKGYRE